MEEEEEGQLTVNSEVVICRWGGSIDSQLRGSAERLKFVGGEGEGGQLTVNLGRSVKTLCRSSLSWLSTNPPPSLPTYKFQPLSRSSLS